MISSFPSKFLEILELIKASIKDGKASEFFLLKMHDYLFLSLHTSQPAPFEHHIALKCGDDVGAQYRDLAHNPFKVRALTLALKAREDFFLLCMGPTPAGRDEREKALNVYRGAHQSDVFRAHFPDLLVRDPDFFARVDKGLISKFAKGRISQA